MTSFTPRRYDQRTTVIPNTRYYVCVIHFLLSFLHSISLSVCSCVPGAIKGLKAWIDSATLHDLHMRSGRSFAHRRPCGAESKSSRCAQVGPWPAISYPALPTDQYVLHPDYLPAYVRIYVPTYRSTHLPIYLSIYLAIHLSLLTHPSIYSSRI